MPGQHDLGGARRDPSVWYAIGGHVTDISSPGSMVQIRFVMVTRR